MLRKRIFVGALVSIIQIAVFYATYKYILIFDGLFGMDLSKTVFESIFLDWFINDYVLVFAMLILLQNLLIIITWRKKWTILLRIITSILHTLFWLDNMETLKYESMIMGVVGLILIWLGPLFELLFIKLLKIEHPYRERDYYEDLN
ncbi:hypothetical protein GCM10027429_05050 [Marivirga atlantica]|jgi:hypothetical protein|uniref:Uncharacterized protein n=1 Tax=Marivirga atlantica TaxID=1548457 RepID=A0A937ACN6_9BACT|nr:hypothetical protein [Marivirga atlantica]MBL0764114.1 hypothetical protein [Marivirga atlantica]